MRIAQLTFYSFGKWEALGEKKGNWQTPSRHSVSLWLVSAERLVKETKGEEILANCYSAVLLTIQCICNS